MITASPVFTRSRWSLMGQEGIPHSLDAPQYSLRRNGYGLDIFPLPSDIKRRGEPIALSFMVPFKGRFLDMA